MTNLTLGNFTNVLDEFSGQVFVNECVDWCRQEHFIINFHHVKFLQVALIILIVSYWTQQYKHILDEKVPKLKWLWGLIIRQSSVTAGMLIAGFLIWNMHTLGKINLPFLN